MNSVCAHAPRTLSMCCDTENFRLNVTPSTLSESTLSTPGTAGGEGVEEYVDSSVLTRRNPPTPVYLIMLYHLLPLTFKQTDEIIVCMIRIFIIFGRPT